MAKVAPYHTRRLLSTGQWLVSGLHAIPSKFESDDEYIKEHLNQPQFDVEAKLLKIACEAGCAPLSVTEAPRTLLLRKHETLASWVGKASADQQIRMAKRVLSQIRKLHSAGVCHRDIKLSDIVLDGETPLFVDFELGTLVEPTEKCYDLYGPAGGVPLPEVHKVVLLLDGVWWDSPTLGLRRTWPGLPSWRVLDA
jgi:serine/threonine protein kinase